MSTKYDRRSWLDGPMTGEAILDVLRDIGVVLTPDTSVDRVVRASGAVAIGPRPATGPFAPGATIWLGEGVWDIGRAGMTVSQHNIRIVGCGRRTALRRSVGADAPLITWAGENGGLSNVRIIDEVGTENALSVTGDGFTASGVIFEDCYRAVVATGAGNLHLTGLQVEVARATDYSIQLAGTINVARLSDNYCAESGQTASIHLGSSVDRAVLVGNVCKSDILFPSAGTDMAVSDTANSAPNVTGY